MKAEIWCVRDFSKGIDAVRAWVGDIPFAPVAGQGIELFGFGSIETIKRATWDLEEQVWCVEIGADYTGEYRAEAVRRGFDSAARQPHAEGSGG